MTDIRHNLQSCAPCEQPDSMFNTRGQVKFFIPMKGGDLPAGMIGMRFSLHFRDMPALGGMDRKTRSVTMGGLMQLTCDAVKDHYLKGWRRGAFGPLDGGEDKAFKAGLFAAIRRYMPAWEPAMFQDMGPVTAETF